MAQSLIILFICFGFCSNLLAKSPLSFDLKVERLVLENGLTVLLHYDPKLPMVSYHTWYRVGSVNESQGHTGLAHMLEHMMFKGAKKYSGKEFDQILHSKGIINNAFTNYEYTGFYQRLPSEHLGLMMDMEFDRMTSLLIAEKEVMSEKKVVAEERRWRIDNQPYGRLYEQIFATVFSGTNYAWPVIGHMADIEQYQSKPLREFYEKFYGPENVVLVIAGRFDMKKTIEMIKSTYGRLVPRGKIKKWEKPVPVSLIQNEKRRIEILGSVQAPVVAFAFPAVSLYDPLQPALQLLASILGSGQSSRLHTELVYRNQIADSASAMMMELKQTGVFLIQASAQNGQTAGQIEKSLRKVLLGLKSQPITEKELQKAKNIFLKAFVDSLVEIDSKAQLLAVNEILSGDYQELFRQADMIQKVTLADLEMAIKKIIRSDKENVFILSPGSSQ